MVGEEGAGEFSLACGGGEAHLGRGLTGFFFPLLDKKFAHKIWCSVLYMDTPRGNARVPFGPKKPQRVETGTALSQS